MKKKSSQGRSGSRGGNNDRSRPASGRSRSPRSNDRDSRPTREAKSSSWDEFDRDSAPRAPRGASSRSERPDRESGSRGRSSASREEGKRPYQRREDSGDRPSYPRRDRSEGEDRKPFGDREGKRPYQRREDSGDRPSYPRRDRSEGEDRKPFGDREGKRPYQRREDSGDRPSYPRRDRSEGEDRKPFGDREGKRPYQRREDSGDRPSYPRRDRSEGEDRKSYGEGESKRPYTKKVDPEARHARFEEKQARGRGSYSKGGDRRSAPRRRSASQGPDLTGEIRLNRFIGMAGIGSRREADDLITAGLITVNGKLVTELGTKVKPGDDVRYNGERIRNEKHVYLLLNKPKDYITTAEDPNDRKTVMELISGACQERVYPVGRLDRNTTGLLLFTNDGDLAKHLTHPSSRVKKIYHVELDKNVKVADMRKLTEGIELEDGLSAVDEVSYEGDGENKKLVGVQLHSGKNRVVRRLFETLGYDVQKLDRVGFAGLTKKDLPRGRWRMLDEKEVGFLKMMGTGKKKFESD